MSDVHTYNLYHAVLVRKELIIVNTMTLKYKHLYVYLNKRDFIIEKQIA